MAHDNWPQDEDVPAVPGAGGAQITAARRAAIAAFKSAVRYPVFIFGVDNGGDENEVRPFQAVQGMVKFDCGFVAIAEVRTGVTRTNGAVDAGSGTVIYADDGYEPHHEPDSEGPITWLAVGGVPCGLSTHGKSVTVKGSVGAYAYCPDDVWQAIIDETVARASTAVNAAQAASGIAEYEVGRGDERVKRFDPLRANAQRGNSLLSATAQAVAQRYKRR